MKYKYITLVIFIFLSCMEENKKQIENQLYHIVLFQFKDSTSEAKIEIIKKAALELSKIQGVENLTWGQNVSPEKLNKGLTHSLTMTFKNEYDRDSIYLPHPTHVDFGEVFVPELENLVVYDYWSNN